MRFGPTQISYTLLILAALTASSAWSFIEPEGPEIDWLNSNSPPEAPRPDGETFVAPQEQIEKTIDDQPTIVPVNMEPAPVMEAIPASDSPYIPEPSIIETGAPAPAITPIEYMTPVFPVIDEFEQQNYIDPVAPVEIQNTEVNSTEVAPASTELVQFVGPTIPPSPEQVEQSETAPSNSIVVPVSDSPPLPAPLPPLPDVNQPATAAAEPTPAPVEEESAVTNRTIVEYQRYRQSSTRTASNGDVIELTNLNSRIGSWYVLRITQGDKTGVFHLETSIDVAGEIVLTDVEPYKVRIPRRNAVTECEFWKGPLKIQPSLPFVSICDSALLIRRRVEGHRSTKEWVVDILRDQVWGGEEITTFVKKNFFADGFMIQSDSQRDGATKDFVMTDTEGPAPARVAPESVETRSLAKELGIQLIGGLDNQFLVGRWYRTKSHPSTYVSLVQPKFLAKDALEAHKDKVAALDQVESNALHYLVAFDLSAYELHFALGTDHPRVEWSDRVLPQMRDKNLNGPDGFATVDPLVTTGMVPPRHTNRIVSAFTGGFKRTHGAFKWGQLSLVNRGSHYGFAENGVMFSKLNTGLATLAIMRDGEVIAKTWQDSDRSLIPNLLHARQNGVAIVDRHPQTGAPVPGDYVKSWGLGNWSGSQDSNLRTLRAGVCVAEANGKRFLIYGYFSSVTPSAMARVFMAYGCSYAFHLDMNALEHTYLSMISTQERGIQVEHLIQGMNVLDQVVKGKVIPRFVGFADNRDFFYLVEKQP